MSTISNIIIPILVLVVIIYGIYKKIDIYDIFMKGAKEGLEMGVSLFPCLLAMILAVNVFLKSGFLTSILSFLNPLFNSLSIPVPLVPLMILRPISGSSSLAILTDILKIHGPDSYLGFLGSVIQGSTETTIYILTLYFGSLGIKKIKYALKVGLLADFIAFIVGIIIVNIIFS